MADEAGFLELLVANERIGRWLDVLCDPYQRIKHKHALSQLQQDLNRGQSYVEEANRLGAVPILTKLLSTTTDEDTLDQISSMIALCSGPMACGGKVTTFTYGTLTVAIREGALGDGLGAKVWSVCHIMARELLAHPEIFKDQQVLEIGSGTGLVGLVAALAGAQQVVLTDHEDQVLFNLRTCMHMNAAQAALAGSRGDQQQQQQGAKQPTEVHPGFSSAQSDPTQQQTNQQQDHQRQQQQHIPDQQQQQHIQQQSFEIPDDAELFDDAESVEDFELSDLVVGSDPLPSADAGAVDASTRHDNRPSSSTASSGAPNSTSMPAVEAAAKQASWEAANMAVRMLDWQESEDALLQQQKDQPHLQTPGNHLDHPCSCSSRSGAPGVPLQQQYPVILGNEVMYEKAHARLVAAAIKHRLQLGGRALLCCAVRDQAVFDAFREYCRNWGLRYRALRVQPQSDRDLGGIAGRERDYEGGYLLMAVDHATAPADDWHRDDFVDA